MIGKGLALASQELFDHSDKNEFLPFDFMSSISPVLLCDLIRAFCHGTSIDILSLSGL